MFINRQFFFLWLAQSLSQLGTNILLFFVTFFVYRSTRSNSAVSVALLFFLIPSFFSSFIAGIIVDRMGKRWILFLSNIFRACIVLFMLVAPQNIFFLYTLIFFLALTTQFFAPAESSIIPKIVPAEKLISANAYFSTTTNLTLILGFLISPLLLKLVGLQIIFIIFFIYVAASIVLYFVHSKEPLFYTNLDQPVSDLFSKFSYHFKILIQNFTSNKQINKNILSIILLQVVLFVLIALSPGFADKILKVKVEELSFLIILPTALGFLIASILIHSFSQVPHELLLKKSMLAISLSFFMIFLTSHLTDGFISNVFNFIFLSSFGFFSGLIMIRAYAKVQIETGEQRRAGYFGILNAFINLASVIPVLLTGVLSDIFGVDKILLLLSICFFFLFVSRNR